MVYIPLQNPLLFIMCLSPSILNTSDLSLCNVIIHSADELQSSLEQLEKEKLSWQTMYEVLSLKTNGPEDSRSPTETGEEKILAYYRGKMNALIEEKQKAEGKATLVSSECVALHKRLEYLIGKLCKESIMNDIREILVLTETEPKKSTAVDSLVD